MILECPYYSNCGGCQLLHMTSTDYNQHKIEQIKAAFHDLPINYDDLALPMIEFPTAVRRRAVFKLRHGKIGFFRKKSHDLIPIKSCKILSTALDSHIENLRLLCRWFDIADIYALSTDCGLDVQVLTKDKKRAHMDYEASIGLTNHIINSAWARLSIDDAPFITIEKPFVTIDNVAIEVSPNSFLQASTHMEKALSDIVTKVTLGFDNNLKIIDLFCGRGTLSLPLSKYGCVDGFECDSDAVDALNRGAMSAGRNIKALTRDLFKNPIDSKLLSKYDLVVINPPRAGAIAQIRQIKDISNTRILYVSCSPQSLAADLKILMETGKNIEWIQPIDAFFGSHHTEVVALIK
jgi:23S rRNA (uracil1939-C5)-methyltransferase